MMPRLILRRCLIGTHNNKKVKRPSGALKASLKRHQAAVRDAAIASAKAKAQSKPAATGA